MRVHFTAVFSTIVIVFPVHVGTHRGRRRMARRNNTTIISFPSPSLSHPSTSAGHLSLHTPDRPLIHSCSTYYYVRSRTCDDDCRVIIVVFFSVFALITVHVLYAQQRRRRFDVVFFVKNIPADLSGTRLSTTMARPLAEQTTYNTVTFTISVFHPA